MVQQVDIGVLVILQNIIAVDVNVGTSARRRAARFEEANGDSWEVQPMRCANGNHVHDKAKRQHHGPEPPQIGAIVLRITHVQNC